MECTEEKEFIRRVDGLSTGDRAALRRCCGTTLQQAGGKALTAFYRVLPRNVSRSREEGWFEGACLRCLWKPEDTMQLCLENALAAEQSKTDSDSLRTRLIALLDTPMEEDDYFSSKLWRLVRLMQQKGYVLDCAVLIYDLCHWNSPERYIQKKWARGFSRTPQEEQDHSEGENKNVD